MGIKGSKTSQDSVLTAELIVEKLQTIGGISSKKMFGGHGIFHEGSMFGIVDPKGQAYFKVDDSNRDHYEASGSHQHSRMPYFSLSEEVLKDIDALLTLAGKSIAIKK